MLPKLSGKYSASKILHRSLFSFGSLVGATVAIVLLLSATVGCTPGPTETREDSFTVAGYARLVVKSENGNIVVNAGAGNEVLIKATLTDAPRVKYELSQVGDSVIVDVKTSRQWWISTGAGVDITITTPSHTDVELESSNGFIELQGLKGSGSLRTSNGKVILDTVQGDFDVRTSNGRIEVSSMSGDGIFKTSNSKVDLRDVDGEYNVETSNSPIFFSGNMTAGGSNTLITSNGAVTVELTGTPSVVLDAETSNGEVTSELPILATITREERLVDKIGNGEAELYIRTSNSNVTIR